MSDEQLAYLFTAIRDVPDRDLALLRFRTLIYSLTLPPEEVEAAYRSVGLWPGDEPTAPAAKAQLKLVR